MDKIDILRFRFCKSVYNNCKMIYTDSLLKIYLLAYCRRNRMSVAFWSNEFLIECINDYLISRKNTTI